MCARRARRKPHWARAHPRLCRCAGTQEHEDITMKITKRTVAALAPGAIIADSEIRGFVARCRASGAVTYGYRYRANGKQRWLALGFDGRITPEEARGLAKRAAGAVAHGNDPQAERAGARAAAAATVNKVLDSYLRSIEERKLRSAPEVASIFDRLVRPRLGERSAYSLERADILDLLDQVADDQGPVMADKVLDYVRAAFGWYAVRDPKFNTPIVRGMSRTKTSERARSRILADDEIRDLWNALDDMPPAYAAFLRTLLLTGQRRDEVRRVQWSELSSDNTWTIPSSRYKGKRDHVVPITAAIAAQLGPRRSGYIFSRDGGRVPLGSLSTLKHRLEAKIAARRGRPISEWRLHDLRRTARTLLSRAGVPADIAERVIGHAMHGVRGTYDRFAYITEKRDALERLAGLLERILHPEAKVVAFPKQPA
jgi:integrase